jgi:hypothetical protein
MRTYGFCGVLLVALSFSIFSCSKSNNNSSKLGGTLSFEWNGQSVSMPGQLDTFHVFTFIAVGVLPGRTDTSTINIVIPNLQGVSTFSLKGTYTDTAANYDQTATFAMTDLTAGLAYQDYTASRSPFTFVVSSNNGVTINATFSGMVGLTGGSGPDSLLLSNGRLSINY